MANDDLFKKIISHSKEYGYVFPSSEIYDGLGAVYDYGPYGSELKRNIEQYWWKSMVQMHENIVGIDAAIFMHPNTWKASGHVDAFNDPLIDNKQSKKRYRADVLIENHVEKIRAKITKEVQKAKKRFGDDFDEEQFLSTNPRVIANQEKIGTIEGRFKKALEEEDLDELKQVIVDCEIADPESGSKEWTDVRQFNLMFSTQLGSVADKSSTVYLRPETAQGIFVNFLNVLNTSRQKVPFGIAQVGKAFRNEIVARQFIFRTREFTQMEMQFFVRPGTEMEWYEHWKSMRMKWHRSLGFTESELRFHEHLKPAHYANAAVDIEFEFPFGVKEIEGIHSRTDFDLTQHQELSGKKLQYYDPELEKSYVPYVVETSIGLDRTFLAVLCNSYKEEVVDEAKNTSRVVLKLPAVLAPVKVAVLPLVKKDGLPEKALEIFNDLKADVTCQYDEKDAIGRRYRRQDAIGTPFAITIDHQTLEDDMVTIRNRDTMEQERIKATEVKEIALGKLDWKRMMSV
ncbi:MAG: glycine--tRNA ligase [Chitinophagales bacterium]|nr:glycine--tRNA ligase [Chitinophagales bacterium]